MRKVRDLLTICGIYVLAYAVGFASCLFVKETMLKFFVFDTVATIVTFIFSVILKNSSVYDAYWSLTPMVMSIWLFIAEKSFSVYQLLFLVAFNVWSLRLTLNWVSVFTDFSYEDWRYRKYRDETPRLFWPLVNFFGIHYMPTLIVFAGMLPLFEIAKNPLGPLSLIGLFVILFGVGLEFFADRAMHAFLADKKGMTVCRRGLWNYSRHELPRGNYRLARRFFDNAALCVAALVLRGRLCRGGGHVQRHFDSPHGEAPALEKT